ncbi:putative hydrolase of the HAD superfamily [Kandleria vitulina]|uniref:Putative hydrolase of the HAD superfamily n=1 Tax=Kandleria vitulina TaxID=1630 RepID=A0A1H2UND9_9FIRM|nr:HAD family hydrolase [Kandleria vitulina]SDW57488.1 putative hydrolase of the HAD superfamily [Kandleria vitulina]
MKNYIFDLYGTLIDIHTDEQSLSFWKKLCVYLNERGYSYKEKELKELYLNLVHEEENEDKFYEIELMNVFKKIAGQYADEFALYFRKASTDYITCFKNTKKVLEYLKEEGKHVYLLSNAQACFTLPELKELGLYDYFDDIFISSSYHIKKPHPSFLEELMDKHHLHKEESVMIGNDFTTDMAIAKKVGITGVFLNTDGYSKEDMHSHNLEGVHLIESGDLIELVSMFK